MELWGERAASAKGSSARPHLLPARVDGGERLVLLPLPLLRRLELRLGGGHLALELLQPQAHRPRLVLLRALVLARLRRLLLGDAE